MWPLAPKIESLRKSGDIKGLAKALQHNDPEIRAAAAQALGELKTIHGLEALLKGVEDTVKEVQISCIKAMVNFVYSTDPDLRKTAIDGLRKSREVTAIDLIASRLVDADSWDHKRAAEALGQIGGETAIHHLLNAAVRSRGGSELESLAEGLGLIGVDAVLPLTSSLKDQEWQRRWVAAYALRRVQLTSIPQNLITVLMDSNGSVRYTAAETLSKHQWQPQNETEHAQFLVAYRKWNEAILLGNASLEPLLIALRDPDCTLRADAARVLGALRDQRSVSFLIEALNDEDVDVRLWASGSLGRLGNPQAIKSLSDCLLTDSNSSVRQSAAQALGEIRSPVAVEYLLKAFFDSIYDIRMEAVNALVKIGKPAVEPLMQFRERYFHNKEIMQLVSRARSGLNKV